MMKEKTTEKNEEPLMTENVFINLFAVNKLLDIPCSIFDIRMP